MRLRISKNLPACRPKSGRAFDEAWKQYVDTLKVLKSKPSYRPGIERKEQLEKILVRCYGMEKGLLGKKILD